MNVRLLVTNPDAIVVDDGSSLWAVHAVPDPGVRAAIDSGADFPAVRDLLTNSPGEYSVVQYDHGSEPTIRAHRGITSAYEVYYLQNSHDVVVTDQFKNAVAALPVHERTVTRDIIADHLLYRTTPTGTYVDEVERLGQGESLTWKPTVGETVLEQHERLQQPAPIDPETAVRRLDDELSRIDALGDCETMLSGGVDSTLLHSYRPEGASSVSGAFDTPEIAVEREYAKRSSALLGADHELNLRPEAEFGERMEQTIDGIGMPPQQIQTPAHDAAYRASNSDRCLSGQLADALFGMGAGTDRLVWLTRPLRHVPSVVEKLKTHEQRAQRLLRPPDHPDGRAMRTSQYLTLSEVEKSVSRRRIEQRLNNRLRYVQQRVALERSTNNYATHMDWGHWIEYFCENTETVYRQTGHARGKATITPFAWSAIVDTAHAVPSPERFVHRLETKHIPKRLLVERVPEYETGKPKGNGNLPEYRYMASGPLAPMLEEYSLPEFAAYDDWDSIIDHSGGLGWVLLSYAMWRDRILESGDVNVVDGTRELAVTGSTP